MDFVVPEGHPLADGYDVVACARCGMVFADTRVSQEAYDRFYADASKYADTSTGTGGGDLPWDDRRLEETAHEIARHLPGSDARVVDIGCANGGLLKWLSRLGYRSLIGVDPAEACARASERVEGVKGLVGSLDAIPPEARHADMIVLSHVLEHVRDLDGAFTALRDAVKATGRVYVEVPDATRYAECLAAPFQDFNTEHINHFSPRSLRSLIERRGFRVIAEGRKTIEASAGVPYPALWMVAERDERCIAVGDPAHDDEIRPAIERYIAASTALVARIDAHLERELDGAGSVIVWGVGQLTLKLLVASRLARADITAFVDTNPLQQGKRLRGVPVLSPGQLDGRGEPIVIGSLISHVPIARRIAELGLPNRVIFLQP